MLVLESLEKSDAKVAEELLGEVTFALGVMVFRSAFTSQWLLPTVLKPKILFVYPPAWIRIVIIPGMDRGKTSLDNNGFLITMWTCSEQTAAVTCCLHSLQCPQRFGGWWFPTLAVWWCEHYLRFSCSQGSFSHLTVRCVKQTIQRDLLKSCLARLVLQRGRTAPVHGLWLEREGTEGWNRGCSGLLRSALTFCVPSMTSGAAFLNDGPVSLTAPCSLSHPWDSVILWDVCPRPWDREAVTSWHCHVNITGWERQNSPDVWEVSPVQSLFFKVACGGR